MNEITITTKTDKTFITFNGETKEVNDTVARKVSFWNGLDDSKVVEILTQVFGS